MNERELFTSNNDILIGQICTILEENNIPYIKNEEGAGEYISVVMGANIAGKRVFVSEENYEKAKDLISPFLNIDDDIELTEMQDELNENDEEKSIKNNKYTLIRRSFGMLWITFAFVLPLIIIILLILFD